jgi:hypothetical protein
MLFQATLWTRELSLKKSTGIFTYPHQTVMDLFYRSQTQALIGTFSNAFRLSRELICGRSLNLRVEG